MNLDQLHTFYTVAKHLSFSLAAEELFMTQPAVSLHVKALERRLKVKLFERAGNKLFLTEAGEVVLEHTLPILAAREEMGRRVAELRGSPTSRISLGANTTGGMYIIPHIVQAFREAYPEAEATLHVETTNRICERVMQNMIDVAVVTGPLEDKRFVIQDLFEDELLLIVSPSHPFASRPSVPLSKVADQPFILPEPGSRTRLLVEQTLRSEGLNLRVTMQLPGTEAVKKAVESNLGVAMVSKYSIQRELYLGVLKTVAIEGFSLHRPIHILYRKGKHLPPLGRRFLSIAAEYVSGHPDFSPDFVRPSSDAPPGR